MFKRAIIIVLLMVSAFAIVPQVQAQCSMCSISADQGTKNGNTQGKGLNDGIVYLLVFPYLLIAGIGILWYRNYRRKHTDEPVNS